MCKPRSVTTQHLQESFTSHEKVHLVSWESDGWVGAQLLCGGDIWPTACPGMYRATWVSRPWGSDMVPNIQCLIYVVRYARFTTPKLNFVVAVYFFFLFFFSFQRQQRKWSSQRYELQKVPVFKVSFAQHFSEIAPLAKTGSLRQQGAFPSQPAFLVQ